MSFSGGVYTSSLAMLLIISLWISGQTTAVAAIRIFPQRVAAAPPGKSQTQIFREYFHSRLSHLNATTNGTFEDYKRKIPSCPDPLHN